MIQILHILLVNWIDSYHKFQSSNDQFLAWIQLVRFEAFEKDSDPSPNF